MRKMKTGLAGALVVLAVGLLCAWPAPATAQTTEPPVTEPPVTEPPVTEPPATEPPETETPSTANPPRYIGDLLKAGDLTQEQADQMRTAGYGWGEIRIATRLAQQILAANTDGTLTFADALKQVTDARAAGKGWGQIAADNNLKIGGLVGNRKGPAAPVGPEAKANEVDGDEEVAPDPTNPPAFITKLVEAQVVTQDQVNAMLASGYGWGEVRIATLLSQKIAANSNGALTFADALKQVTDARAAGKDFGQIAADNNLKIGRLVGNRKGPAAPVGPEAQANEVDGDEEVAPDPANPPAFITKLVEAQVVTQDQVNSMLAAGYGWGEVRIATLLSQKIAANSNGTLTFADALKQVTDARAAGKDFGQIATDNNLKIGDLVRHQKAGDAATAKGKKPGIFARMGRALGFGRSADKPAKLATVDKPEAAAKGVRGDKPERPERVVKAERPERPERPAQPERPERPERPSRPDKPERPERGPR